MPIFETGVFLILVAISLINVFSLLEGRDRTGAVEEDRAHCRARIFSHFMCMEKTSGLTKT